MSAFNLIEGDVVLRDSSGNPVGVVVDGATYRLQVQAKVTDGTNTLSVDNSGKAAIQNPSNLDVALSTRATEATVATLLTQSTFNSKVGEVQATPTANTLLGRLKDLLDGVTARLGTLGQKTMANSTPVAIASDQSRLDAVLRDASGNALPVANRAVPSNSTPGLFLMGVDSTNTSQRLSCTDDGRLLISAAVQPPPNRTSVSVVASGSINSTTGTDDEYVIPTGQSVTVQTFSGGAAEGTGGSKVQLYYSADAAKTSPTLIATVYVNGDSATDPITYISPAGTGTNRLFIRRTRFSNSSAEVYGKWNGYY